MSFIRRALVVVVIAVLGGLSLSGCGAVRAVQASIDLDRELSHAGYPEASVSFDTHNGRTIVTIENVAPGPDAERVAGVVWRTFKYRVSGVEVGSEFFDRSALQESFGPRNPDYDRTTFEGEFVRSAKAIGIGIGVGMIVLLVVATVLAILLLRRSSRKRQSPAWAGGYPPQTNQPPRWPPPPQGRP